MKELIEQIQSLDLRDSAKASILYDNLSQELLEKYGGVNDDFDGNPKKRGTEWLDIIILMKQN